MQSTVEVRIRRSADAEMTAFWIAMTLILAGAVPWPAKSFTVEEARVQGYLNGNGTVLETRPPFKPLNGSIPPQLGSLTNLTYIDLPGNDLTGPIPPELGNLTELQYLNLYDNDLVGPIPREVAKLTNLQKLDLSYNNLVGPIPPELGNLTELQYLNLYNNNLTGPIPREVAKLTNLQKLDLSYNNLVGPIPPELANLTELVSLYLSDNNLVGPIPPELGKLTELQTLHLSESNLTGPIPWELGKLTNLQYLFLNSNNLVGSIPPTLGNLTSLQYLLLNDNSLSGPIPPELGSLNNLDVLDVSNNKLSGSIPSQLANLPGLISLSLSNNNLSGAIPSKLSKVNLWAVFFDGNPFLGPIPAQIASNELSAIGIAGALPEWIKSTVKSITYILVGPGSMPKSTLDLTNAPATCHFVEWMGGRISEIIFWDACYLEGGCAVSLIGSKSTLSQSTRRRVCLNKISVFLEGERPRFQGGAADPYLYNSFGSYYLSGDLSESHGIDTINLGPNGSSYTGVGVTLVQKNNLCGNPGALKVVLVTFGTFLALLPLIAIGIWGVQRLPKEHTNKPESRLRASFIERAQWLASTAVASRGRVIAAYVWGIIGVILMALDMYSDIAVLVSVWGIWPMWIILPSIGLPFVLAGFSREDIWYVVASLGATR
jgi:Leucine-rich repeat (LRR) protein